MSEGVDFFIVSGETSGDVLGARLMVALRNMTGGRARFRGVGGPAMAAEGLVSLFSSTELSIVGVSAVVTNLPQIIRRIEQTAAVVLATRPDALILIDSPDFTHRVAVRVRTRAPEIPIIDYVSPSVWAWRPWRARAMRRYIDRVLALLPFEPDVHRRLGGPPCVYVGHPIIEHAAEMRPSVEEARRREAQPARLVVLPGSRRSELKRLSYVFGQTLLRLERGGFKIEAVVPTLPHLREMVEAEVQTWRVPASVVVGEEEKFAAFRTARAALAASGTVTLELAVAGVPTVVAYRLALWEAAIAGLMIRVPSIVLANLVLGENVMPELVQFRATPRQLAIALMPLLSDTPQWRRQLAAFARIDRALEIDGEPPSMRAARAVLETVATKSAVGSTR